jgi:predicted MFS family arabinose efflux permease
MAPRERRGRIIGLYGLAIWGGLSLGPPIGELILRSSSFEMVWAFAAVAPAIGAVIAMRIPERYAPTGAVRAQSLGERFRGLIAREALLPGSALALAVTGYATLAAFIVLHLDERGIGHGAVVFTAFAFTVVAMRIVGGAIPDRFGGGRSAAAAGLLQALGLFVLAATQSLTVALLGAAAMGAGFALLFPSLALLVINEVPDERRGAAMGTFTAFFDVGVGVGAPLAGVAAAIGGYGLAFALAGCIGLGTVLLAVRINGTSDPGLTPQTSAGA